MKKIVRLILLICLVLTTGLSYASTDFTLNGVDTVQPMASQQYELKSVYFKMRSLTEFGPWEIYSTWENYGWMSPPNGYHYVMTGEYNFYVGSPKAIIGGVYERIDYAVPLYELVHN